MVLWLEFDPAASPCMKLEFAKTTAPVPTTRMAKMADAAITLVFIEVCLFAGNMIEPF